MSGGAAGLASVMQQSLQPKRSSGHYPSKSAVVAAYKRMVSQQVDLYSDGAWQLIWNDVNMSSKMPLQVQTVLESREERAELHKALKEFHG